jgi:hypothetical protein
MENWPVNPFTTVREVARMMAMPEFIRRSLANPPILGATKKKRMSARARDAIAGQRARGRAVHGGGRRSEASALIVNLWVKEGEEHESTRIDTNLHERNCDLFVWIRVDSWGFVFCIARGGEGPPW